jgi:organic radical activating enzyme
VFIESIAMETRTLCNHCYKEVFGDVAIGLGVWIIKHCPSHGIQTGLIEKDAEWYKLCKHWNCKEFYPGYLIDITSKCNLSCKYCYHPNENHFKSLDKIVRDAQENIGLGPTVLTGGEPTLHKDLINIIKEVGQINQVWLLTNGTLVNDKMLENFCNTPLLQGNILNIGFSFHKESEGKDLAFLQRVRREKLQLSTCFVVIDTLDQIDRCISLYKEYEDIFTSMRIKASSNVWNTKSVKNQIFTSQMVRYLYDKGAILDLTGNSSQKVSYASMILNNMHFKLVSWYSLKNVDLNDINCGPWYRGKDGVIRDFVYSMILNER